MLPHEQVSFYLNEAVSHYTPKQVNLRVPPKAVAVNQANAAAMVASAQTAAPVDAEYGLAQHYAWKQSYVASWKATGAQGAIAANAKVPIANSAKLSFFSGNKRPSKGITGNAPHFGWSVVKQIIPAFCIPDNSDLLQYWDRLEDRLHKIRHCEDITGAKRQLALFAPPIDPLLLVEAMAAGLSLDDVLSSLSGDLPPYRFTYLIEKAKQYAAQVQSFGAALLSALDRRDAEQLNVLHLTQQQNILTMTTKLRQQDIDQAQNSIDSLTSQQATVQYRHDYYQGLLDAGMNAMEITQSVSRHTASATFVASALLAGTGGVLHLIPQLGSPFAMKYGGMELGSSVKAWSKMLGDTAKVAEVIAASAGLQAGFDRRDEGWKHQVDLASKELDQITKQLKGANIRLQSAQQSMAIHQKTIQQTKDVFDFYKNRFTNLGLYTWLATTMQRVFRDAFNGAYAMAKLAEQAYRFERNDDTSSLLSDNYWSAAQNGLLSGENLLADLGDMERRFIESNYRALEIDQSFSLAQLAPAALLSLRENATCDFTIPELAFDLFYPGTFCRQIKAIRLTIPTVTGPFTNVSATLTLTGSKLRLKPELGAANLQDVPVRRSVSIATSTGQSDSGVFEFSFRDERYMPFEGAGGISSWNLMLPQAFRQFDYDTIPDVVVHVSYTAQQDGTLRKNVEEQNAGLQGTLLNVLKNQPIGRLFSLRQEFSSALNRLQHSAVNTPVKVTLTDKHLPVFVRGHGLAVTRAQLVLNTSSTQTVHALQMQLDGTALGAFARDATLGNLWATDILAEMNASFLGDHLLVVTAAGDLALAAPAAGDLSALDDSKLSDILLYVEYKLL